MIEITTVSSRGRVTIPASFRVKMGLSSGSKVAFIDGEDGRVYVIKASSLALEKAQEAFAGFAEKAGFKNEDEAMAFAIEIRKGKH